MTFPPPSQFGLRMVLLSALLGLMTGGLAAEPLRPAKPATSQAVPITFLGTLHFTTEQLREAIAEPILEIKERGLTKPRADDTAYYLGAFYRKQGFPNAQVDWQITSNRLILKIQEGPRTYLRTLNFTGNQNLSEATLFDYFLGIPKDRLVNRELPFVETDLQDGAGRLRALYESEGFLDAIVEDPVATISKDQAHVSVQIREGSQYTFGPITFGGEAIFAEAELIKGLGVPLTKPYTPQDLNTMQRNLQFFYKSHGYFDAQVAAASDPLRATKVPIHFDIQPGPLYRFDGITVKGTQRLQPQFLPKRLASLHGQIYSPAQLDEKYRELLQTGLFSNLRIDSVPQSDHTIRLDLSLEEAKAKEVGFSIGAGSYEGISLGLRLGNRNLFGYGRPFSFNLDASQRSLRSELLYVDPWFLDTKLRLRARLYAQTRDEEGYSKRETGLRADLSLKLTSKIELSAFAQAETVEITDFVIEPQYMGSTSYTISTIGLTQSFDFRDHPINPNRGWLLATSIDVDAIDGQPSFARATLRYSYYYPLTDKIHLALGARAGAIAPFDDVPIDERYFNGGATTVRSFSERNLGAKDRHGYPIGGEVFTVWNAELTFPIAGALQGATFVDAGNLIENVDKLDFVHMSYAIGLGLRYKLPIGPLRLDYGLNPNPRRHEDVGAFHFSFGFAF